jgi:fructokinase
LELANALKLNEDELAVVAKASGLDGEVSELLRLLLDQFDLRMVVLTQGSKGSVMTTATEQNFCPATNIQLVDAVGAGDSFTASVVMGMLYQTPIAQINKIANRIAASVCENAGAARPDVLKEIDVPWRKIE